MYHNDRRFTSSKGMRKLKKNLRKLVENAPLNSLLGVEKLRDDGKLELTQVDTLSVTKRKEVTNQNLNHLHVS